MTDSLAWQVITAVQLALQNIDYVDPEYPGVTSTIPVYIRDGDEPDKIEDTVPCLILVSEDETVRYMQLNNTMDTEYPVLVLFLQNFGVRPEQARLRRNLRENIRKTLFYPGSLTGLGELTGQEGSTPGSNWDIGYDPKPGIKQGWGPRLKASGQRFTFVFNEVRANIKGQ
jgi:hypothetical protein